MVKTFERFTDRARRSVVLAQEEARLLGHNYIGTEHLLLGLTHEGEGVAAKALANLGITLESLRARVEDLVGEGNSEFSGHIPFTPRAKKVIELSLREALQLGHNYIGTEHVLLGLVREGEGIGAQVLIQLGADLSRVRQEIVKILSGYVTPTQDEDEDDYEIVVEKVKEDDALAQWYLVEYVDAKGASVSMVVNSPDGWYVSDGVENMLHVGGHAINRGNVISVFKVDSPPAENTITPAGMKPFSPKPEASIKSPPVLTPAASVDQLRKAVEDALHRARLADPDFDLNEERLDPKEAERRRLKAWGKSMSKAIEQARAAMKESRLAGGVIYVPDDGSAPSYIAPNEEGLQRLDEILVEYEGRLTDPEAYL